MNRQLFYLLLLLASFCFWCVISCGQKPSSLLTSQQLNQEVRETNEMLYDADSYAIYSELLNKSGGKGINRHVVKSFTQTDLSTRTDIDTVLSNIDLKLSPDYQKAFEDYKLKNQETWRLKPSFNVKNKVIFITNEEISAMLNENPDKFWEAFYSKYPNSDGYRSFSRIGFDDKKQHAFVYQEVYRGLLDAGASYILLKKVKGVWKQTDQRMVWAS